MRACSESSYDENPLVVKEIYSAAMRKVEKEARKTYAGKISGTGSEFRLMMMRDGCLFLQLALFICGCSHEILGYQSNDRMFGPKGYKRDVKKWIEAMFFPGNQIPLVVLKELMKQEFFQDVLIERGKWDTLPPQSDLCRKVLYELLILPALKENLPLKWKSSLVDQQPSDVLHGLHNLVLGPGRPGYNISGEQEADDDIDLEANEEYFDSSIIHDEDDETSPTDNVGRIRTFLKAIGFRNAIDYDRKRIFPSVTELKRAGIHVKKLKTGGVRSIWFESWYFWAYLYLLVFPVEEHTQSLFRNLKMYEKSQQLGTHRREVSSYLRVMSNLIQTTADAKLLKKHGVVVIGGNSDYVEKLRGILDRLSSDHNIRLTRELHTVRRQISDYSSPWVHYKGLVNLVALLTVIQTLFALLAYFKPPKS